MKMKGFWYNGRFYPIMAGGNGADDGAGDGGTGDDGDGDPSGDGTDSSADGQQNPPKPKNDPKTHTLTQKQLSDRIEQSKRSERAKLAREAGFGDDVDGYLKAVKQAKATRDAELTETQRLTERVGSLSAETDKLRRENAELKLNSFVTTHAIQLGFLDPMDAARLADFSSARDDDGNIDGDTVNSVLKDLAKRKPYLVKAQNTDAGDSKNGSGGGSGSGTGTNRSQSGAGANGTGNRSSAASNPPRTQGRGGQMAPDRIADLAKRYPGLAPAAEKK